MKKISRLALSLMFIATVVFTSCDNKDDNNTTPQKASLYQRLGGTEKVQDPDAAQGVMIEKGRLSYRLVVNEAIKLIVADISNGAQGNFGEHFAPLVAEVQAGNTTNVAVLSKNLTDFFSANTGGGSTNTYSGLSMVAAHNPAVNKRMGKKSSNADYDKFIGYVGQAAANNGVTDKEIINDVVAVLESLRSSVVQQ